MDVTRDVFFEILPELEEAIEKALFISIDGEFTGITNATSVDRNTPWDPPEQVYSRLHQKASDFLLIQFGMCVFYHDEDTEKYTHQAYNFYVFPQCTNINEPDSTFRCQTSSLAFLAHEGFDFNKLFRKGIPFLNHEEEERRRKALDEKWKAAKKAQNKVPNDMPVPEDKKRYLEDVCDQVKKFLEEGKNLNSLLLTPANPFVRKLIYQEVEKEYGSDVCLRTEDKKDFLTTKQEKAIFVFRSEDKQAIKAFDEEAEKREWRELEEAVGFSHVVKLLSKSGKLIVGHNMLLDMCHTVNRFVRSMPDNYYDFKHLLHKTFPRVIDTKVMTSLPPFQRHFQSTTLQTVFETLSADPFKPTACDVHNAGMGYSTLKAKEHEAGYDAYLTGLCFLSLCDYLRTENGDLGIEPEKIARDFLNKVYIWISDAPYIKLGSGDPNPGRQHVFHVEYPHEWKRTNITRLFKSVGPVNVSFLDEKRAYVAVINKNNISMMKSVGGCVVTRYDKYHSIQYARNEPSEETAKNRKTQNHQQGENAKNQNKTQKNKSHNKKRENDTMRNVNPRPGGTSKKSEDGSTSTEKKNHKDTRKRTGKSPRNRGHSTDECIDENEEESPTFEPPPKISKSEFAENNDWD